MSEIDKLRCVFTVLYQYSLSTARCTLVHSAVTYIYRDICRPSVCTFVCDVDGSGSHRLEIVETNCTDN